MKTTFDSSEIAHVWFHQSAPFGKSPSAMSFDGPVLKSYATAIARLVEHKGQRAVIINDRSFSVSTSKHQGRMRCAIPDGTPKFKFSEGMGARLDVDGKGLFDYAVSESANALAEAAKTKHKGKKERMEGVAGYWLDEARRVNEFFGLKRKIDEKTAQRLSALRVREEKRAAVAREKREADARKKAQEDYDAWKRGEDVHGHFSMFPVAFRVEADDLVSSLGARVPLHDAKVALRFVQSRKGQEWRENGETCPVGNYAVQSITPAGIVAGCHRISWEEISHVESLLA